MGKRILKIFLAALILAVVVLGGVRLRARPAPPHPYFAATGFQVIAHRGGRGLGPENTLAAFRRSMAAGADVLEMDVRTTADGHLVVLHDATVDRTTDGSGAVNEMTLAQLKTLDAGYRWTADQGRSFPFRGRGITVPSLSEVLAAFADTPFITEIKEKQPEVSQPVCDLLHQHGQISRVLVASVHAGVLKRFRQVCPGAATSAGPSEALWFYLFGRAGLASLYSPAMQALQVPVTFIGLEVVTSQFVAAAHARNMTVAVWTVNAEETMRRLITAGVDGIMTDYPDRLADIIEETRDGR
ncbi:MAG: glycerophosphodiester phosphodiesterase [Desulfobacterales bacterium]|jgi:glycerophosphoryl diester phosphodiesterase